MRLQILQVPDCPNAAVLAARLAELAGAWPDLRVTHEVVTTQDDAERLGMTGSPTLLADGTDPFARAGQVPGISCRRYRDEQGRPARAPSSGQLRAALRLARRRRPALSRAPAGAATRESGGRPSAGPGR
jgi:hypothetical protein